MIIDSNEALKVGDIVEIEYVNSDDIKLGVKLRERYIVLENSAVPFCIKEDIDINRMEESDKRAFVNFQVKVVGENYEKAISILYNYLSKAKLSKKQDVRIVITDKQLRDIGVQLGDIFAVEKYIENSDYIVISPKISNCNSNIMIRSFMVENY